MKRILIVAAAALLSIQIVHAQVPAVPVARMETMVSTLAIRVATAFEANAGSRATSLYELEFPGLTREQSLGRFVLLDYLGSIIAANDAAFLLRDADYSGLIRLGLDAGVPATELLPRGGFITTLLRKPEAALAVTKSDWLLASAEPRILFRKKSADELKRDANDRSIVRRFLKEGKTLAGLSVEGRISILGILSEIPGNLFRLSQDPIQTFPDPALLARQIEEARKWSAELLLVHATLFRFSETLAPATRLEGNRLLLRGPEYFVPADVHARLTENMTVLEKAFVDALGPLDAARAEAVMEQTALGFQAVTRAPCLNNRVDRQYAAGQILRLKAFLQENPPR